MSVRSLQGLSVDAVAAEATKNIFKDPAAALRHMEHLFSTLPWLLKIPVTKAILECMKKADASYCDLQSVQERQDMNRIISILRSADGKMCRVQNCKLDCRSLVTAEMSNHYQLNEQLDYECNGVTSIHACLACDGNQTWKWAFKSQTLTSLKIGEGLCPSCHYLYYWSNFNPMPKYSTELLRDAMAYGRLKELILFHIQLPAPDQKTITELKTLENLGLYKIKSDLDLIREFTCETVLPKIKRFGCDPKLMLQLLKDPCHQRCIRKLHWMDCTRSCCDLMCIESPEDLSENLLFVLGVDGSKFMEIKATMEEVKATIDHDGVLMGQLTCNLSEPDEGTSVKEVSLRLPIAGEMVKHCGFRKMAFSHLSEVNPMQFPVLRKAVAEIKNLEKLFLHSFSSLSDETLEGILAIRHIPVVEVTKKRKRGGW